MEGDNDSYYWSNKFQNEFENSWEKFSKRNNAKWQNYVENETFKGGMFTIVGAFVGGVLGGPPGAIVGAALAGGSSGAYSVSKSC